MRYSVYMPRYEFRCPCGSFTVTRPYGAYTTAVCENGHEAKRIYSSFSFSIVDRHEPVFHPALGKTVRSKAQERSEISKLEDEVGHKLVVKEDFKPATTRSGDLVSVETDKGGQFVKSVPKTESSIGHGKTYKKKGLVSQI